MKVSACPNCGGSALYQIHDVDARGYGFNLLPLGIFNWPTFTVVVCSGCGLTRFFAGPEALEKLRESRKWMQL